jgi:HSP20 family protein
MAQLLEPLRGVGQRVADFFAPSADAADIPEAYEINVELPGVSPDDISLDMHGNTLVLSGEKRWAREEKGRSYFFSERAFGSFHRTFRLPPDIVEGKITADFNNGVLSIRVPKAGPAAEGSKKILVRHS